MSWFGTLIKWVILLPILVVIAILALANDQAVTIHLNPFNPADPVLQIQLALYQVAFATFVIGALIGALVTWGGQRRHRRAARDNGREARRWRKRVEDSEPEEKSPTLLLTTKR
ncbi:Uncharacterized integral membrane protein [Faunimonas pinastri]|uniref:Uncharacterized integral membrane protein n=1 Tax=Faunimonas pinastri TaxID=1855383 RepID=A0A1H9GLC4_9HYPH|nr:LapA family protein [Faunimonas pinastri]SEQ50814.1 Uncharacterized integral membrane protein [Faunimonas pinastri]